MPEIVPQALQLPLEMQFSNQEIRETCQPTPMQRLFLESMHAKDIRKRLALQYDPNNPMPFLQEESYLKARIELIHELLNLEVYYPDQRPQEPNNVSL